MKKQQSIVALIVTVALAMVCLGETVFSLGFGEKSVVPSAPASSAMPDSQLHHRGKWMVNNYCNRISISAKEVDGEPCTELKLNRKDCDTQFAIRGGRLYRPGT